METFYFTFGQAHRTIDDCPMKDFYVKVEAEDYGTARELFCTEFAAKEMGNSSKWAFQYNEQEFSGRKHWFPLGEFATIRQQQEKDKVYAKSSDPI